MPLLSRYLESKNPISSEYQQPIPFLVLNTIRLRLNFHKRYITHYPATHQFFHTKSLYSSAPSSVGLPVVMAMPTGKYVIINMWHVAPAPGVAARQLPNDPCFPEFFSEIVRWNVFMGLIGCEENHIFSNKPSQEIIYLDSPTDIIRQLLVAERTPPSLKTDFTFSVFHRICYINCNECFL